MELVKQLRVTFFAILIFFGLLYVFTTLFGPLPLSVNSIVTNKTDLFTVSGEGEATAVPDTAQISLGVTKQAATVAQAQNEANSVVNKITSDLKGLGVKETDIKTTNYNVTPNYDFTSGQKVTGYSVSQNLDVKLKPIDQANKAIDIATADGANVVGGVNFVLDDQAQNKLEMQARKEAINNAKKKAQEIASLSGIRLGKIINVFESNNSPVMPYARTELKAADSAGGGVPTEVSPGENSVNITVSLSYETL